MKVDFRNRRWHDVGGHGFGPAALGAGLARKRTVRADPGDRQHGSGACDEDRDGVLWIGTIGDGLLRYSDGQFTHVTAPDNPPSSTVLAIFDDNEQNIWAGMQTGLLRLSRAAMSTFPLPDTANADFGTVYPDPDGSLWVASTHLFRINARRDRSELVPAARAGHPRAQRVSRPQRRALDRNRRRRRFPRRKTAARCSTPSAPAW